MICELGQAFVDSWKNCKWDKSDRTKHDDYGDGKDNINDKITDDDDDDKSDDRWQCVTLGGCSLEWFTEQRMHPISETCFDIMVMTTPGSEVVRRRVLARIQGEEEEALRQITACLDFKVGEMLTIL